jgi:gas vesicle protein
LRKGFITGLLLGGLVGTYYGMQLTTREKSELRGMAMNLASRSRQAMQEARESIDDLMD